MGLKFFTIPAMHAEQWEAELNGFLAAHRVTSIEREFAIVSGQPVWCFVIEFVEECPVAETTPDRLGGIDDPELEILLEVARRANWDALHGPRHLQSGRFHPVADESSGSEDSRRQESPPGESPHQD